MEDLIALLIPLIAVAGWLFGLFKNEDAEKNEQPKRQENRGPAPRPQQANQDSRKMETDMASSSNRGTKDNYERKKEQVSRLQDEAKKASQASTSSEAISGSEISMGSNARDPERRVQENTGNTKAKSPDAAFSVKKNMTKKGLAESVIMAEVLGSPRAVKPYRSIISERKR